MTLDEQIGEAIRYHNARYAGQANAPAVINVPVMPELRAIDLMSEQPPHPFAPAFEVVQLHRHNGQYRAARVQEK